MRASAGSDQAYRVQRGRAQVVGDTPDIGDRVKGLLDQLVEQSLGAHRIRSDRVAGSLGRHRQGGQLRPQSIVEIPAQSTTLLLAGSDEPLPRALQVLRETDRLLPETDSVDCNARLMGQVLKQPALSRPERLLTSARTQYEPAQCFATVEKRQSYRVRHRLADARRGQCGLTLDEFDGGIGQLQPLLQRKNHCG